LADTFRDIELLNELNGKEDYLTVEGGELADLVAVRCERTRDQLRKLVIQLSKEKNLQKEVEIVNEIQKRLLKALNISLEVSEENAVLKENPDKIVLLETKEETEILDIEQQLTQLFNSFVPIKRLYVKEYYLPRIGYLNASVASKLPKEERVAAIIDLTANGSCKNCIVFGTQGLYYCNGSFSKAAGPGFINYKEFCSQKVSCNGPEVAIGNINIYMENSYIKIGDVTYILESLQKTVKESIGSSKKKSVKKEKKNKKSSSIDKEEPIVTESSSPLPVEVNLIDI